MRAPLTAEAQRAQRKRRGFPRGLCVLCASAVREAYFKRRSVLLKLCKPIYLKLNKSGLIPLGHRRSTARKQAAVPSVSRLLTCAVLC
jgi:hypothetical protein